MLLGFLWTYRLGSAQEAYESKKFRGEGAVMGQDHAGHDTCKHQTVIVASKNSWFDKCCTAPAATEAVKESTCNTSPNA